MTRIQLSRMFVLALLSAAAVACGRTKGPAGALATTNSSVDAGSPAGETDGADTKLPPPPEPPAQEAGAGEPSPVPEPPAQEAGTGEPSPVPEPPAQDGGNADADQTGDGPAVTDDLCARFCAVLVTTACPPDATTCQTACAEDLVSSCAAEARADYTCEATLTAANYTCNARGGILLNPGNCDDEQTNLGDCLLGGL